MRIVYILTITLFMTAFWGCGPSGQEEYPVSDDLDRRLQAVENQENRLSEIIHDNPGSPEYRPVARRLVDEYRQFADHHPGHEQTPEMLFRAANLRADALHEYAQAINMFQRIRRDYPDSEQAERSLFLIAYTQSAYLDDKDAARETYQKFLEEYPDSDLSEAAQQELEFMDVDIDEFLRNLE